MIMRKVIIVAVAVLLLMQIGSSYLFAQTETITRQEMLRGSVTPEREWWDVLHYDLKVEFGKQCDRGVGSAEYFERRQSK